VERVSGASFHGRLPSTWRSVSAATDRTQHQRHHDHGDYPRALGPLVRHTAAAAAAASAARSRAGESAVQGCRSDRVHSLQRRPPKRWLARETCQSQTTTLLLYFVFVFTPCRPTFLKFHISASCSNYAQHVLVHLIPCFWTAGAEPRLRPPRGPISHPRNVPSNEWVSSFLLDTEVMVGIAKRTTICCYISVFSLALCFKSFFYNY